MVCQAENIYYLAGCYRGLPNNPCSRGLKKKPFTSFYIIATCSLRLLAIWRSVNPSSLVSFFALVYKTILVTALVRFPQQRFHVTSTCLPGGSWKSRLTAIHSFIHPFIFPIHLAHITQSLWHSRNLTEVSKGLREWAKWLRLPPWFLHFRGKTQCR